MKLSSYQETGEVWVSLKEYYHAAQFRSIECWCRLDYVAKWKDKEKDFVGYPIQSIIGEKEIYKKKIQEKIDPITSFTLDLWFRVVQKYRINDINQLKWLAFDSSFKPNKYDRGFKT